MQPYDHLKLYLVSRKTRWSYPALSNQQVRWQYSMARLESRQLPSRLAAEGFAAIVVDRFGYDDNGAAVTAAIRHVLGGESVIAQTDRYLALDIRSLADANTALASPRATEFVAATLAMGPCGGLPLMNIEQVGDVHSPFGGVIRVSGSRGIKVTGWAVDQQSVAAASEVDIAIDGMPFPSIHGSERRDVADYFKRPAYVASGFVAEVPADTLAKGNHALTVRVVSSKGECYYESAGLPVVID